MSERDVHVLSPVVRALTQQIEIENGYPRLSGEAVKHWTRRFRTVDGQDRDQTAAEVIALARRFRRHAPRTSDTIVLQLSVLVVVLARDRVRGYDAISCLGVDRDDVAKVLGRAEALTAPSTEHRARPSVQSMLAARMPSS